MISSTSQFPAARHSQLSDTLLPSSIMSFQPEDAPWPEGPLDLSPSSTLSFTFPGLYEGSPLSARSLSDSALVPRASTECAAMRRTDSSTELSSTYMYPTEEEIFRHYNELFSYYRTSCNLTEDQFSTELEHFSCPVREFNSFEPYPVSAHPSGHFGKLKSHRRGLKAMSGKHVQEGPGANRTILKILRMKIQQRIENKLRRTSAVAFNLSSSKLSGLERVR